MTNHDNHDQPAVSNEDPQPTPVTLGSLLGLFGPEDTAYLCSVHWVRYQRSSSDEVDYWWDETCTRCDHDKARPLFATELAVGGEDQ